MSDDNRAQRLSLSPAQRNVIDSDEVAWHGWDARHLPVVSGPKWPDTYQVALDRRGVPVDVTHPIETRRT
jgi:hypothetical protein